jgi:hypothetical protein
MKTPTLIICSLLCAKILFSQKIITVVEQTIRVEAMKTEEVYFGFAAGDQLVFNFFEKSKKDLKEVEILEYPYHSRFAVLETGKVENKTLQVARTGVFRFRFYNGAKTVRECKISIQRIPASKETIAFNTNVDWHSHYDTSYYTIQEQSAVNQKYVLNQIMPPTVLYIDGGKALSADTKSATVLSFQLPHNTIEWYYRVSVLRGKAEEIKNSLNLAGELTNLIEQTGGLQFGPDRLAQGHGETHCDVYLMNKENATHFEAGEDYKSLIGSSRHIQSIITKVYGGSSIPLYIGINNPDSGHGVNVLLECVAIVLNEAKAVKNVEKINVASRMVPVLNIDNNISWAH